MEQLDSVILEVFSNLKPQQLCVSMKSLIFSLIYLKVWKQGAHENNILRSCSFWFCKISSYAPLCLALCMHPQRQFLPQKD